MTRPSRSVPHRLSSGKRYGPVLVAIAAVAACSSNSAGDVDLAGRTFVSTQADGHDLVEGTAVRVTFTDDSISVDAGCNILNAGATWDAGSLDVPGPMATTMMACEPDLQAQDEWLQEFLTSSPDLALDGAVLTVGDAAEGITLVEE